MEQDDDSDSNHRMIPWNKLPKKPGRIEVPRKDWNRLDHSCCDRIKYWEETKRFEAICYNSESYGGTGLAWGNISRTVKKKFNIIYLYSKILKKRKDFR